MQVVETDPHRGNCDGLFDTRNPRQGYRYHSNPFKDVSLVDIQPLGPEAHVLMFPEVKLWPPEVS